MRLAFELGRELSDLEGTARVACHMALIVAAVEGHVADAIAESTV